jgi:hypothetical protein
MLRRRKWSNGQSSYLQIQRSGFDSLRYQIFWEAVGLGRGHLASWVQSRSYLKEEVATWVQKSENTAVRIRHADHPAPSIRKKLTLTSPTSGDHSYDVVRSRTQATEFLSIIFVQFGEFLQGMKLWDWSRNTVKRNHPAVVPYRGRDFESSLFSLHLSQDVLATRPRVLTVADPQTRVL